MWPLSPKQLLKGAALSRRKQDLSWVSPGIPFLCHVEKRENICGAKHREDAETGRPKIELISQNSVDSQGKPSAWLGGPNSDSDAVSYLPGHLGQVA